MKATYSEEELDQLLERERKFVRSIEDDAKRNTVACSILTHRLPDTLVAGDDLPDLRLQHIDGKGERDLHECVGDRPLFLAFGSYT